MKLVQQVIIICIITIFTTSCVDIKKYKQNLNSNKKILEGTEEVKHTENKKETYQSIDFLRKKTTIYNDSLLDVRVIKKIKTYYYNIYNKEWKTMLEEVKTCVKLPIEESKNDTIVYLGFKYSERQNNDPIVVGMIHCTIPIKQGINLYMSNPILYTDLNKDGINDLIVVVHTEGGWRGGNTYNQDIFVFINEKDSNKLASVISDRDMVHPEMNGYIRVKNVENGILMAEAFIYTERDARCCPSDHYFMRYKFEDNKFVIINSEFRGTNY